MDDDKLGIVLKSGFGLVIIFYVVRFMFSGPGFGILVLLVIVGSVFSPVFTFFGINPPVEAEAVVKRISYEYNGEGSITRQYMTVAITNLSDKYTQTGYTVTCPYNNYFTVGTIPPLGTIEETVGFAETVLEGEKCEVT